DAFSKSSSIVQNQLLDLPSNTPKIALVSSDSPASAIPAIDSVTPLDPCGPSTEVGTEVVVDVKI
ncbi:unnamed protein product, partial [Rotaria sp. Silwood2]